MDVTQFYPEVHLLLLLLAFALLIVVIWLANKLGVSIDELRQAIGIIKGNQADMKKIIQGLPQDGPKGERGPS